MKLTVMLPVDKATAIEVIKQQDKETAVPLLSLILGNWMLCEKPVFDKLEILDLAQDAGKDIFVEALLDRLCNCGNYNDYDKFFDLASAMDEKVCSEVLLKIVQESNPQRMAKFVAKCRREYEQAAELMN